MSPEVPDHTDITPPVKHQPDVDAPEPDHEDRSHLDVPAFTEDGQPYGEVPEIQP